MSSPAFRFASTKLNVPGSNAKMASLAESIARRYRSSESRRPWRVERRALRIASKVLERSPSSPGARRGTSREKSPLGTPRAAAVRTSSGFTSRPRTRSENSAAAAPRTSPVPSRRSFSPWTDANASRSSWASTIDQGASRSWTRATSQRVASASTIPVEPGGGSGEEGERRSSRSIPALASSVWSASSSSAATAAEPYWGSSRNPASFDTPSAISPSSAPTGLPPRSTMGWTSTAEGPGRHGSGCAETWGLASASARRTASCQMGMRAATRSASYGSVQSSAEWRSTIATGPEKISDRKKR